MSLRARAKITKETPLTEKSIISSDDDDEEEEEEEEELQIQKTPISTPSSSQQAITQTLASTAQLANLLPTGTILALQLLTPVFTSNGACDSATRPMTLILLLLLSLSCFLASFTDSLKMEDGKVYHGIATFKGIWLFDYQNTSLTLPDLSKYRLRFIDFVHAILSVFVFFAVALRDRNILNCFYPMPSHETQEVLNILPVGMGLLSSLLFLVFPTSRHGIGYPVTSGN